MKTKNILGMIILLLSCAASSAFAGGLSEPIVQPPVGTPATYDRWAGAYVGGAVGQTRVTNSYEEQIGYVRECRAADKKWGGKCTVSQDDWDHSPELLALGEPVDGHPSKNGDLSTDFRYEAGYPGVWIGNEDGYVRYTSLSDETIESNYATNTVIGDVFRTVTSEVDNMTYGVFAGYRHAVGGAYIGAELGAYDLEFVDDPLITAELTGSVGAGNMLFTLSGGAAMVGDEDGLTGGLAAEYAITQNISLGAKVFGAKFDDVDTDMKGALARVSFSF